MTRMMDTEDPEWRAISKELLDSYSEMEDKYNNFALSIDPSHFDVDENMDVPKYFISKFMTPPRCLNHYKFGRFLGRGISSYVFDVQTEDKRLNNVPLVGKVTMIDNGSYAFFVDALRAKKMGELDIGPTVYAYWICGPMFTNSYWSGGEENFFEPELVHLEKRSVYFKHKMKIPRTRKYGYIFGRDFTSDKYGFVITKKLDKSLQQWIDENKNRADYTTRATNILNQIIKKLTLMYENTGMLTVDVDPRNNVMMGKDNIYIIDFGNEGLQSFNPVDATIFIDKLAKNFELELFSGSS